MILQNNNSVQKSIEDAKNSYKEGNSLALITKIVKMISEQVKMKYIQFPINIKKYSSFISSNLTSFSY